MPYSIQILTSLAIKRNDANYKTFPKLKYKKKTNILARKSYQNFCQLQFCFMYEESCFCRNGQSEQKERDCTKKGQIDR